MEKEEADILHKLLTKSITKQKIYQNTYEMFQILKQNAKELTSEFKKELEKKKTIIPFEYIDKGEFNGELKFAGDMLIMTMHTNVFEFPRDHSILKTSYVTEDPLRGYCGVIYLYNFLADSFKYNRQSDSGYLVARIFINKDYHYFVEGKKQIGFLFNDFINGVIDKKALRKILELAVNYCLDFDLLTPPYDTIKEMTVEAMLENTNNMNLKTGKRLGFLFRADALDMQE
jgi:hypothetical protein